MTAYEMRISDWSSDVCSSDLAQCGHDPVVAEAGGEGVERQGQLARIDIEAGQRAAGAQRAPERILLCRNRKANVQVNSEASRGGKECVSKVRSGGSPSI